VEGASDQVVKKYAARSPAETFACVVESFFEQPVALQLWDTALYRMLSDFFQQDPARGV
jgi:Mlc titration factor MtfA (ptsG expression regulator)